MCQAHYITSPRTPRDRKRQTRRRVWGVIRFCFYVVAGVAWLFLLFGPGQLLLERWFG